MPLSRAIEYKLIMSDAVKITVHRYENFTITRPARKEFPGPLQYKYAVLLIPITKWSYDYFHDGIAIPWAISYVLTQAPGRDENNVDHVLVLIIDIIVKLSNSSFGRVFPECPYCLRPQGFTIAVSGDTNHRIENATNPMMNRHSKPFYSSQYTFIWSMWISHIVHHVGSFIKMISNDFACSWIIKKSLAAWNSDCIS